MRAHVWDGPTNSNQLSSWKSVGEPLVFCWPCQQQIWTTRFGSLDWFCTFECGACCIFQCQCAQWISWWNPPSWFFQQGVGNSYGWIQIPRGCHGRFPSVMFSFVGCFLGEFGALAQISGSCILLLASQHRQDMDGYGWIVPYKQGHSLVAISNGEPMTHGRSATTKHRQFDHSPGFFSYHWGTWLARKDPTVPASWIDLNKFVYIYGSIRPEMLNAGWILVK